MQKVWSENLLGRRLSSECRSKAWLKLCMNFFYSIWSNILDPILKMAFTLWSNISDSKRAPQWQSWLVRTEYLKLNLVSKAVFGAAEKLDLDDFLIELIFFGSNSLTFFIWFPSIRLNLISFDFDLFLIQNEIKNLICVLLIYWGSAATNRKANTWFKLCAQFMLI